MKKMQNIGKEQELGKAVQYYTLQEKYIFVLRLY